MVPRRFQLHRLEDVSGVSGVGVVADGVLWPDGTATVRWRGPHASVVFWPGGIADVEAIHGHNGATQIRWLDPTPTGTTAAPTTVTWAPPPDIIRP